MTEIEMLAARVARLRERHAEMVATRRRMETAWEMQNKPFLDEVGASALELAQTEELLRLADRILGETDVDAAIFSEPVGGNDRRRLRRQLGKVRDRHFRSRAENAAPDVDRRRDLIDGRLQISLDRRPARTIR